MWKRLDLHSDLGPLRDPVLLVALSTSNPQYRVLYSQARELGKFLLKKMDFKLVATLYSSSIPSEVKISNEGIGNIVSNNFYVSSGKKRDYMLLAGQSSPVTDEYEYCEEVLSLAKKAGVRELYSIGARWTDEVTPPLEAPKVLGFANDVEGMNRLNEAGVSILKNESAYFFANTIVPLAKSFGIRGYKLSVNHGEPLPHPKSSIAFLRVLSKMVELDVDDSELLDQTKQLAETIQKGELESPTEDQEGGPQKGDIYR